MSRPTRTRSTRTPDLDELVSRVPSVRPAPSSVLAAVLLAIVGGRVALAGANNLPGPLPAALAGTHRLLLTVGPTVIGLVVVLLALAHRDAWTRTGLAFAGAFGLLGLHAPSAALPAALGVAAGAAVPLAVARWNDAPARAVAVGATLWLGLAASLASATGVVDASVRPAGSALVLAGVASLPLVARPSRGGWGAGVAAAALVGWTGSVLPFVTGAVALVAFGVVGTPLVLVAGAAGGGVAGLAGAIATRRWELALGAGLVVLAGVPATIPDALAAGAGLAVLLGGDVA